ncbi:MAG: SMC-Scp complex subunit ScpB [Thermodesulfobacteriota bacterium]
MDELKNIIESLLFISDDPLSVERIKTTLPEMEPADIRTALGRLVAEYEARSGGFILCEVAGGYQFRTNPAYREWVTRLVKPSQARLSKASLETLAIIAYRQPIMRTDIEHIRGVDSGGVLRMLMERRLIRVLGRKEIPGRPLIYATTKEFLELFGLKDLKELPSLKEIESFSRRSEGTPNPFADQPPESGGLLDGRTPEAEALAEQLPESERPLEYAGHPEAGNTSMAATALDTDASAVPGSGGNAMEDALPETPGNPHDVSPYTGDSFEKDQVDEESPSPFDPEKNPEAPGKNT